MFLLFLFWFVVVFLEWSLLFFLLFVFCFEETFVVFLDFFLVFVVILCILADLEWTRSFLWLNVISNGFSNR